MVGVASSSSSSAMTEGSVADEDASLAAREELPTDHPPTERRCSEVAGSAEVGRSFGGSAGRATTAGGGA